MGKRQYSSDIAAFDAAFNSVGRVNGVLCCWRDSLVEQVDSPPIQLSSEALLSMLCLLTEMLDTAHQALTFMDFDRLAERMKSKGAAS